MVTAISGGKTSWLSPKSKRNSQSLELSNRFFEEERGWRLWWVLENKWVERRVYVDCVEAEPADTKQMYGWVERFARSLMVLGVNGDCQNDKRWRFKMRRTLSWRHEKRPWFKADGHAKKKLLPFPGCHLLSVATHWKWLQDTYSVARFSKANWPG